MNTVSALAPPAIALLIPLVVVMVVLITRRGPGADDPPHSDAHGGGPPRNPPPSDPRPPGHRDPDGWPEFERAFAAYVRDHAATRSASCGDAIALVRRSVLAIPTAQAAQRRHVQRRRTPPGPDHE